MPEAVSSAIAAMEGHGFYNRNSSMQAAGNATALALWEKAAQSVDLGKETLVIVDYGSSQGLNSMEPISTAIRVLRVRRRVTSEWWKSSTPTCPPTTLRSFSRH